MKNGPIVAEVRKARAEIVRECGNDLARLFDRLCQKEQGKQPAASRSSKRKPRAAAR